MCDDYSMKFILNDRKRDGLIVELFIRDEKKRAMEVFRKKLNGLKMFIVLNVAQLRYIKNEFVNKTEIRHYSCNKCSKTITQEQFFFCQAKKNPYG